MGERRSALRVPWDHRIVMREDLRTGAEVEPTKGMPTFRKSRRNATTDPSNVDDVNPQGYWDAEYVLKKPPSGQKFELLQASADRANMVVNWLNHNLAYCSDMLIIPAPIQSRMYQEISNGMLGFNTALKVADVPFCFPYSQIILILLIVWMCLIPFYIVSLTRSLVGGPLLAYVFSAFMLCMNRIAKELENPFGQGANRVCVPEFHSRFLLVVTDSSHSCFNPPKPPKVRLSFRRSSVHSTATEATRRGSTFSAGDGDEFEAALGQQELRMNLSLPSSHCIDPMVEMPSDSTFAPEIPDPRSSCPADTRRMSDRILMLRLAETTARSDKQLNAIAGHLEQMSRARISFESRENRYEEVAQTALEGCSGATPDSEVRTDL